MTDRELMRQALEALEMWCKGPHDSATRRGANTRSSVAITALRERLAQPEQEPVAFVDPIWMQRPDLIIEQRLEIKNLFARVQVMDYVPLYTAPQQEPRREWVGLTPEEAKEISLANRPYVVDMIAALEARLKEKNT